MAKMELKTKTRIKEVKTFVKLKSVALGMGRWGVEPVYKKDYVKEKVVCICLYNIKAIVNNLIVTFMSLNKKEAI